ncbi:MAG: chemotaxis protein CheX [Lentisphaeria bacterium]|nr:chemotaxis protein CheX [Lentisphaeria bacterium]NQZ70961.1 chemotaxis protein CheX [Lentisphaeria bacterium]
MHSRYDRLIEISIEMFESIFDTHLQSRRLYETCKRPDFDERFIVIMNFTYHGNDKGQIILGIPESFVSTIIDDFSHYFDSDDEDDQYEFIINAFEEILNTICSEFTGDEDFIEEYGSVSLAVPVLFDRKNTQYIRLPQTNGIKGELVISKSEISIKVYLSKLASDVAIDV